MSFKDQTSKAAQLRYMREQLANSPKWLVSGLLTIYANQTAEEQKAEATTQHNGIGFAGPDAKYLTSVAVQAIKRGVETAVKQPGPFDPYPYISQNQWPHVHRKMQKYAGQLCEVARQKQQE